MEQSTDELLSLIERGRAAKDLETPTVDFKVEGRSRKEFVADLAADAVCFANASGGRLIIGVRDAPGGPEAIVGSDLNPDQLRSSIHDLTEPSLLVNVDVWRRANVSGLVIQVPEGLEVYSTSQGGYRQRWQTQCLPMTPADVSRLSDERRGADWSAGTSDRHPHDSDPGAIAQARELLAGSRSESARRLADKPFEEVLASLGLLAEGGMMTRAGALLFVEPDRESAVYQFRKTSGGETDVSRRWRAPLITTFVESFETISLRLNTTPVNLATGQQIALEDYPAVAVREALANALIHRDQLEREPVHVIHTPDTLAITSPGPLVSGVTESNILVRGTKPRYPLLARACNALGLVEYLGLGVNRMFREMARAGRPLPSVQSRRDSVRITMEGGPPNIRVARLIATLPQSLNEDTDTLLTIVALRSRRSVSAKNLMELLQKGADDIEVALRRISAPEVGLIEPSPATRNRRLPSYHLTGKTLSALGSAVSYHTRTRDEVDRKVIDHVRDFDVINNGALQRMLDVDVYAARDLLRELVLRGILVRTSVQTRGKSVRYGPGPKFPGPRHEARTQETPTQPDLFDSED